MMLLPFNVVITSHGPLDHVQAIMYRSFDAINLIRRVQTMTKVDSLLDTENDMIALGYRQ